MKYKIITFLIALLAFGSAGAQIYDDEESEKRQKVSLGTLVGLNTSGLVVHLPEEVLSANAGVAGEIILFTEYHINEIWGIRLVVAPSLERVGLVRAATTRSMMSTGTLDIALPLTMRLPVDKGAWFAGVGPFSRFVLGGGMSDGSQLPYTQQVGLDSITGEPRYAVDKFGSGFNALIGYENLGGLIVQVEGRMGLTNILNTETYRGEMWPFKVVVSAGYRF